MPIVELAEKLARIAPGRLEKRFFTCSGTEADETAVMLAQIDRAAGDRRAAPRLLGPLDARAVAHGHATYRAVPTQIAAIKHAPAPYCYRCPLKLTYPSCGVACAQGHRGADPDDDHRPVAGFIAEPIQGVGGFVTPPREYFKIAVGIVRKHGGVFICDEVQTGFGRTGGTWWGIEHWNVSPTS